jgi:hypothetical protein
MGRQAQPLTTGVFCSWLRLGLIPRIAPQRRKDGVISGFNTPQLAGLTSSTGHRSALHQADGESKMFAAGRSRFYARGGRPFHSQLG